MTKFKLILFLFFLLVFVQCKKEEISDNSIIAGYHDSSMFYKIQDSSHNINFQWDSLQVTQWATDTLLIEEGSSVYTLIFSLYRVNPDSLAQLPNNINYYPYTHFSVRSINSDPVMIRYITKKYYAGLGTVASFDFVKPIQKNAGIREDSMKTISNRELKFYEIPPPGGGSTLTNFDNGPWYNIHAVRYVGILINKKLGWIKLDLNNNYQPRILAYAIQK